MTSGMPEHYPILVVDDHPTNRQVLQYMLSGMGLNSEVAASGDEAAKLASAHTYGAILMDIMMPHMDGYEATKRIRNQEFATGRNTPIIAVTALDLAEARDKCLAAGMNDFILKPVGRDVLRERLERWLQQPVAQILSEFKSNVERAAGSGDPINREGLRLLYGTDQLSDVLKVFLSATEALLAELKAAIHSKNLNEAIRIAHELKGSAFAVSAEEMAQRSKQLQEAVKSSEWQRALAIYAQLAISFANLTAEIGEHTGIFGEYSVREQPGSHST